MTEEVHTRPLPPAGAPTAAAAGPTTMDRVDRALEWLWHFLTSMRVAMVLMLAIAALGVIGSLVIQARPGVVNDPAAKAGWLDEIRPKYGGWTGFLDALQLFQIFDSVLFRVLVAALTISLIACTDPPDPRRLADHHQAARGRWPGVLRACPAARGHRRPAQRRRDAGSRGRHLPEPALPHAVHRRRRRSTSTRTATAWRRGPVSSPTCPSWSSCWAPLRAPCSASGTRSSRSPRVPRSPSPGNPASRSS